MGNDREVPDALLAGIRLGFEPIKNLEIGLSRTMQLCGQNRPCGFNIWTRALIAVGDLDNGAGDQEPGNQLASIDLSYSINLNNKTLKFYIEGTAEDESFLPYQYSRLIGSTIVTPIGDKGDNLAINIELSDSGNVKAWFFGERRSGIMYNHSIYRTGHRYDGRTLGHSLDNDSKLASISASITKSQGESYSIILRTANLNWDNTPRNIISNSRQSYNSLELLASKKFRYGLFEIKMNVQSQAITLTQGVLPRYSGELTWRIDL